MKIHRFYLQGEGPGRFSFKESTGILPAPYRLPAGMRSRTHPCTCDTPNLLPVLVLPEQEMRMSVITGEDIGGFGRTDREEPGND